MAKEEKDKHFDWPLTGKMITADDPLLLGEGNFRQLINMRYGTKSPIGVQGMTKINTAATSYLQVDNGFNFSKDKPDYNCIIAQTTTGANSRLVKSDIAAAIPAQDTFSNFQTLADNDVCYFSQAPNGAMVVCNGDTNYIYGGPESDCGKFINFAPDDSFKYDYTDIINNTLTDSENVATMHLSSGTADADTVLLLHFENNDTDSSASAHAMGSSNTYSSSIYKFGAYSAAFNGTNQALSTVDHADFDFSDGTFTIDTWIRVSSLAAANPIYYQNTTNDNDSFNFYVHTDGSVKLLIKAASATVVSITTPAATIAINTWYHVELVENGDDWYIFIDGILKGSGSDASRAANYTGSVYIGHDATAYYSGYMDEFRVSDVARHTADFTPEVAAYGSTDQAHISIMSLRALDGVKFYVGTANATAATVKAYVWNGTGLEEVASLVDGTATTGKTLAKTGTISFTSTVGTAELRYYDSVLAYYYLFVFDSIDTTTTVSHVTVSAPIQELADIWDGSERPITQFYKYETSYSDLIVNVYAKDYVSTSSLTYAQIGALTSAQYLYIACGERLLGLKFFLPDATYVNDNANTIVSVDYWNGTAWTALASVQDGTTDGTASMAKSGAITWLPPSKELEFETTQAESDPWYYYRVHWSNTLAADVRIDYVSGLPAPITVTAHRFPLLWQNRLWLLSDQAENKNVVRGSAALTNCVFNGDDSAPMAFGGAEEVVAGATLFSRFGNSLYDNMVVLKRKEVYLVDSYLDSYGYWAYRTYLVSSNAGCVAPLTTKACALNYEVAPGITKHVILWQSDRGIEMFDGNALSVVSDDIADYFDPTADNYINPDVVNTFASFFDDKKREYHWLCATGSSTVLNKELVLDVLKKKWFEIDRGTGKRLRCGFPVNDDLGNAYVYGGLTTGYIERLENGTDFDGNDIQHTLWLGDVPLSKSLMYVSELRHLKLTARAKNTSTATVAVTCYLNSCTTGETITAISQVDATHRLYFARRSVSLQGLTHSLKFVISTDNETIGFEPLLVSGFYRTIREDR